MTQMATTTVRLPEPLKAESEALAASLGISLNALMAVALRDYLDRPVTRPSVAPSRPPSPRPGPPPAPAAGLPSAAPGKVYRRPASVADPCPCGSVDRNGYRLKWKHCHGKA